MSEQERETWKRQARTASERIREAREERELPTVQELAREAGSWFVSKTRDRNAGSRFVSLREGHPEWVLGIVRDAHGDFLPDDWRYECIRAALEALAESVDPDDCAHEFADGYADVYTGDLLTWLGSNLRRVGIVDQAVDDLGAPDDGRGIVERMQLGQYAEALEVFESVKGSLEARAAELELDELTREA